MRNLFAGDGVKGLFLDAMTRWILQRAARNLGNANKVSHIVGIFNVMAFRFCAPQHLAASTGIGGF